MKKRVIAAALSVMMTLAMFQGNVAASAQEMQEVTQQETEENTELLEPTELGEQVKPEEETQQAEPEEETQQAEPEEETQQAEPEEETQQAEPEEETQQAEAEETEEAAKQAEPEEETEIKALEDDPLALREEAYASDDFDGEENDAFSFFSIYDDSYVHNSRYDGMPVRDGIDVSYYQGDIDWNAVKNSGIEYAIIRAGYRGYQYGNLSEDPKFWQNIQGATAAGLKVGVYIFSQAINEAEAVEEANFILSRISGYSVQMPIVMDFEYVSGVAGGGRLKQAGLSKDYATAVCSAFANTVKNAGYTPMIYANKSMLENQVDGNYLGTNYDVWLAHYTRETSYAGPYTFWQYTSSGYVNGISGRVDMNFWYDDSSWVPPVSQESAAQFVKLLFLNVLERQPAQSEIDYWVQQLRAGRTGADTAYLFIFSEEFRNKNFSDSDYVERLYMSLLGRASDADGKQYWISHLTNGVSRTYIFKQFVNSTEFTNICGVYGIQRGDVTLTEARDLNYNVTRFMVRTYRQFLGREYDADGLNGWCNAIVNNKADMAEIAKGFVFSPECENKNLSNREFVEMLYRGCFDREGEESGISYWTQFLDTGAKNREDVFYGFAWSPEYGQMVAEYGL